MGLELEFTATRFRTPPSGFDSANRFYRQTSGGSLAFSGGRTMRLSGVNTVNGGEPWSGFRYSLGSGLFVGDFVSTTVSSVTQTQSVSAVSPTIISCTT